MTIQAQINNYISSHPEAKRNDLQALHRMILYISPKVKLWFLDGKNEYGKTVSNPNIGYGQRTIKYADGKTKEFYQIGISSNTSGISIYILGIKDKNYLAQAYAKDLGKSSITGYCIKFKTLKDLNIETLQSVIRYGFESKDSPGY